MARARGPFAQHAPGSSRPALFICLEYVEHLLRMNRLRRTGAWVARPLLLPTRRIRWRIMAPYAVLSVLMGVAGTFIVTRLVTGSLEERFTNQLAEASRVTSDSVVRRERQHLAVVRSIAYTEGVAEAAALGSAGELKRLVEPVAANSATELVEVFDANGLRLWGGQLSGETALTYVPVEQSSTVHAQTLVGRVLSRGNDGAGDKFAALLPGPGEMALYTAGPVFDGSRLVGVILVGTRLSSFLPVAKGEALADVTIYDSGGTPVASTFPVAGDGGPDAVLAPDSGSAPAPGFREHRELFGRSYDLLYGQLQVRGEPIGLYSVALPTSYIASAGAAAQTQMALLFAGGTFAILMVGWALSRALTSPLLRLSRAARAVADGDLTARSGVRGRDEIGVLAATFDAMAERLQRQHLATLGALVSAIDARDPYTRGHSVRVGKLSAALGRGLGLPPSQLQHLEVGGYLHDIGKIGVRDHVLLKPGALTPEERKMIELHPKIGLAILAPVDLPREVTAIVGGHHERLNGTGYPLRLSAEELSIFPRIVAVADVYDALTTDRPYRRAMPTEEALRIIHREAMEGMLDIEVVARLRALLPQWEDRRRHDPALQGLMLPRPNAKVA